MILPDKYVDMDHSLLGQSALLLSNRRHGMTVSDLWESVRESLSYERYILALDMLFMLGIVDLHDGSLRWRRED